MVRCASGHAPLLMYGSVQKAKTYYRCGYGRSYGCEAADAIEGHGQWCSVREDLLLPFVERFFAERVFGPLRLDLLHEQLAAEGRATKRPASRSAHDCGARSRTSTPASSGSLSQSSKRSSRSSWAHESRG
jgi:hypothetical protein